MWFQDELIVIWPAKANTNTHSAYKNWRDRPPTFLPTFRPFHHHSFTTTALLESPIVLSWSPKVNSPLINFWNHCDHFFARYVCTCHCLDLVFLVESADQFILFGCLRAIKSSPSTPIRLIESRSRLYNHHCHPLFLFSFSSLTSVYCTSPTRSPRTNP